MMMVGSQKKNTNLLKLKKNNLMEKMVSSENHCQTKAFFLNKKIDTKTIRRILSLPFPKERTSPAGTRGTKWFGIISSEGSVDVHMIARESNIEKLSRGWIASLKHPWSPLMTSGKTTLPDAERQLAAPEDASLTPRWTLYKCHVPLL